MAFTHWPKYPSGKRPKRYGKVAGYYLFRRKVEDQPYWLQMKRQARYDDLSVHDVFTCLLRAYAEGKIKIK